MPRGSLAPVDAHLLCADLEASMWSESITAEQTGGKGGASAKKGGAGSKGGAVGAAKLMRRAGGTAGWHPLIWAAKDGNQVLVETLVRRGARINQHEEDKATAGFTALMWSSYRGHAKAVSVLLSHGADPTLLDRHRKTAAMHAETKGFKSIARELDFVTEHLQRELGSSAAAPRLPGGGGGAPDSLAEVIRRAAAVKRAAAAFREGVARSVAPAALDGAANMIQRLVRRHSSQKLKLAEAEVEAEAEAEAVTKAAPAGPEVAPRAKVGDMRAAGGDAAAAGGVTAAGRAPPSRGGGLLAHDSASSGFDAEAAAARAAERAAERRAAAKLAAEKEAAEVAAYKAANPQRGATRSAAPQSTEPNEAQCQSEAVPALCSDAQPLPPRLPAAAHSAEALMDLLLAEATAAASAAPSAAPSARPVGSPAADPSAGASTSDHGSAEQHTGAAGDGTAADDAVADGAVAGANGEPGKMAALTKTMLTTALASEKLQDAVVPRRGLRAGLFDRA